MPGIYSCFLLFHFCQNLTNKSTRETQSTSGKEQHDQVSRENCLNKPKKKKRHTTHRVQRGEMRLDFSPEAGFSPQVLSTTQYAEVKNTLGFCAILTHTVQTEVNRKESQTSLK